MGGGFPTPQSAPSFADFTGHDGAKEKAAADVGGIDARSAQGEGSQSGIDPKHFDTLVTKNFSSWEDVRTTLGVEPAVIVRLQDKLADRPEVKGWIEKPDDFPAESSQPDVAPPESTAKSAISKRHVAQGLTSELLEMHKAKRHATYEAMRSLKVRKSRARTHTHLRFAFHSLTRLRQFGVIWQL